MKLIICGHGRDGKDTMAEYLRDNYNYTSPEKCFEDRHNHRTEWYDLISEYNIEDRARLARELFQQHDIYIGLRNIEELKEARKLADYIVWVDASKRNEQREAQTSNTITSTDCDYIIDNNTTLDQFHRSINYFMCEIISSRRPEI